MGTKRERFSAAHHAAVAAEGALKNAVADSHYFREAAPARKGHETRLIEHLLVIGCELRALRLLIEERFPPPTQLQHETKGGPDGD